MIKYQNGNSSVELYEDGTRVIQYEDTLQLDYPLNIDIRVSTRCAFGLDPKTGLSFCDFCHESARTDGNECDYKSLQDKLVGLPKGIELAVGANEITVGLCGFIWWCKDQGYIVNLTLNQGHIKRDETTLKGLIDNNLIKGLGISYRSSLNWRVPQSILDYEHTVFHVISGIDSIEDVLSLKDKGVKKVLVLGYKTFGFGVNYFNSNTDDVDKNIKEWIWWVHKMFSKFGVVSFDNLALEQLKIKRFFTDENWDVFNNGEHSFYINAVNGYYSPSSRSGKKTDWNDTSVEEYFINLENQK
jgi:hypothetical protein